MSNSDRFTVDQVPDVLANWDGTVTSVERLPNGQVLYRTRQINRVPAAELRELAAKPNTFAWDREALLAAASEQPE